MEIPSPISSFLLWTLGHYHPLATHNKSLEGPRLLIPQHSFNLWLSPRPLPRCSLWKSVLDQSCWATFIPNFLPPVPWEDNPVLFWLHKSVIFLWSPNKCNTHTVYYGQKHLVVFGKMRNCVFFFFYYKLKIMTIPILCVHMASKHWQVLDIAICWI